MHCTESSILFSNVIPKSVATLLAIKSSQIKSDVEFFADMEKSPRAVFRLFSYILTNERRDFVRLGEPLGNEVTGRWTMQLAWDNDMLKLVSVILGTVRPVTRVLNCFATNFGHLALMYEKYLSKLL